MNPPTGLRAAGHSDFSGVIGAQLSPLAGLELHLEGGGGVLDFEGGPREPRFMARVDLGYRSARWRVGLGLHRGVATDLSGNAFDNLAGRLVIERSLGSSTRASLTGFAALLDAASQAKQQDGFGGVELRLRRQLSREFSLECSYRFWENAGSRAHNDLRQHRGYAQLRYAY